MVLSNCAALSDIMTSKLLYHYPLDPLSRIVRFMLHEKRLQFSLQEEQVWKRRVDFLKMNPAGEVPVFVDDNGLTVIGIDNICHYLEEMYSDPPLIGENIEQRIEIRRIMHWFNEKFYNEVTKYLTAEKLLKRIQRLGHPDGQKIRAGHTNIHYHLDYIEYLTDLRNWLAGDHFSLADIAAAAQISCVDYLGDVPWDKHPRARTWYMRIKSRQGFRSILSDQISGAPPAEHYANLDF